MNEFQVVQRMIRVPLKRAVIETSVTTAELIVALADATGFTVDQVLEEAAVAFGRRAQVGEWLVAWGEAIQQSPPTK